MKIFKIYEENKKLKKENEELKKDVEDMRGDISQLQDQLMSLSSHEESAKGVIERILDRGIEWYDYNDLDEAARRTYVGEAANIVRGDVMQNEYKRLISDLTQHIAMRANTENGEVRDLRMTINGAELIMERLSSIQTPDDVETKEDIHSAI